MKSFPLSLLFGFTAVALLASPQSTEAAVTIVMLESGPDVIVSGSGTINLAGLISIGIGLENIHIQGSAGLVLLGPTSTFQANVYSGVVGATNFGTGAAHGTSSFSGNVLGVKGGLGLLYVPQGYVSNAPLSSTATYFNKAIATMDLTPGTYTYTWGSGPTADSLTVQVGPVPEPGSLSFLALSGLVLFARRR